MHPSTTCTLLFILPSKNSNIVLLAFRNDPTAFFSDVSSRKNVLKSMENEDAMQTSQAHPEFPSPAENVTTQDVLHTHLDP
jgi:hypothetical protein